MEFALGIVAALIGASGAFVGAWLSGRHERQLEQERWRRSRDDAAQDARASAVEELTKHVASAMQNITWFTAAAQMRAPLFTEQTIIDYDTDMRAELAATIQSLVSVAYHDKEAFDALEQLVQDVWRLDWQVASDAASYWSNPEATREAISGAVGQATTLEMALPQRIVEVLHRGQGAEHEPHDLSSAH
jgi:hypothetical protein